jgi:iron complex outermembrane receptor protein
LAQIYFNQTFTNVQNGQIFDAVIANNVSPITKALGIPALKQERAVNGLVSDLPSIRVNGFSATVDGYYVNIQDRIVLTGNFDNSDPIIGPTLDELGVTAAQFFTNAVNTPRLDLTSAELFIAAQRNDRLTFSLGRKPEQDAS